MARAFVVAALAVAVLIASCAPQGGGAAQPSAPGRQTSGPKRITVAITAEPPALYYALIPSPIRASPGSIQEFSHLGLTIFDNRGVLQPVLAEAVPSIENGLWRVFSDGQMETTWKIKSQARWQDGTPLTADDLVFTVGVVQDRELPVFRDKVSEVVDSVVATDPSTVVARWKRPLIEADTLFTSNISLPMPKHLLERSYVESRATFADLPFWSQDFVGAGPFKLKEWVRGSHLVLAANDDYVLGRPKLDEIEVRFISDGNTLISNLLAGSIDVTMRQALSTDQALQMRDQWSDGRVHIAPDGWSTVYPQHVNPTPAIVGNLQFRKALMHGIDRQQLADTLMYGLGSVAHTPLSPDTPEYAATEVSAVRYDYDPQRALQLLQAIGYTRGADGLLRDSAGQPLAFETRASAQRDLHVKTLFPVVDYWKQLGATIESQVIPAQRATDREEQATFPAFQVLRQPSGLERLVAYHSQEARLPERNFTGNNNGRYISPELDVIIERYVATMPRPERMVVASQVIRHITDQLPVLGLFFDATPSLIRNRVLNITPLTGSDDGRQSWNAHEWDVN